MSAAAGSAVAGAAGPAAVLDAVASGAVDEAERLILAGAPGIHATNERGETALHIACDRGYTRLVRLLVQHGANTMGRDNAGRTPMELLMRTTQAAMGDVSQVLSTTRAQLDRDRAARDDLAAQQSADR